MRFSVHTIQKTLYESEDVEGIIAQTALGEISVLDNHLPLISFLKGPVMTVIDKNKKKINIEIQSGFLEVRPGGEVIALIT